MRQQYVDSFPIADLHEHPDNPRRGDEDAIGASLDAHGFYGAVIAQRSTGAIIVGNHRTRVAARRGETHLPVVLLDVDDDEARRILLVDNRTGDQATYDDTELARLLGELSTTELALAGSGFAPEDLAQLLAALEPDPLDDSALSPFDQSVERSCPFCGSVWRDTANGPVRC